MDKVTSFREKYRILIFAFVLTLIHAFIPHVHNEHADNTVIESKQSSEDVLQLFSRVFTFNLGDEHLENYKDSFIQFDFHLDMVLTKDLISNPAETIT